MSEKAPVYYKDYLQLDKIIGAQFPESGREGKEVAHDEMLFIIIHQAYELWFKQILFELDSALTIFNKPQIEDNSADLQTVVHRLKRCVTILRVLVSQIDIIETMTPLDFLDFRDMLRPASGFQSWQFKLIESKLGLQYEQRHGQDYYIKQLRPEDIETIKNSEGNSSLLQLINNWLERMPFTNEESEDYGGTNGFWSTYREIYNNSLAEGEERNKAFYENIFNGTDNNTERSLSPTACRSALFIFLYRGYPMLELPFQLLETLLELDNQLGNWRYRHINMVRRMIGTRIGTGGSSGAGYLQGAMEKHYIFKEIAQLNSFLIDRRLLPKLPDSLEEKLGYTRG